jgi:acyl-CoA synthetase (AMP-forming)/AMP-acid ligase II
MSFKNLYYVGRKKDAVRVKGENISAWEIETTLNQNRRYFRKCCNRQQKVKLERMILLLYC